MVKRKRVGYKVRKNTTIDVPLAVWGDQHHIDYSAVLTEGLRARMRAARSEADQREAEELVAQLKRDRETLEDARGILDGYLIPPTDPMGNPLPAKPEAPEHVPDQTNALVTPSRHPPSGILTPPRLE